MKADIRSPRRCPLCRWSMVWMLPAGAKVHESPDVSVAPPLYCGTPFFLDPEGEARLAKSESPRWACRWCDLGRARLDHSDRCPYCFNSWKREESGVFAAGESFVILSCSCFCVARWYPVRGWGEVLDHRLELPRDEL